MKSFSQKKIPPLLGMGSNSGYLPLARLRTLPAESLAFPAGVPVSLGLYNPLLPCRL